MMEFITLNDILNVAGWVFGGGSIGGVLAWRYSRRRAKAEAKKAEAEAKQAEAEAKQKEAEAAQEKQEYYQRMLEDIAKDRDYYKAERDELRSHLTKLGEEVRTWKREAEDERDVMKRNVARLGRRVDAMAPFLCADLSCKMRKRVTISEDGEIKEEQNNKEGGES